MAVTEPRFRPEDTALLLASYRADRAPRGAHHGHLLSDATDTRNRGKWRIELPPKEDLAQAELNAIQEWYRKRYPDADMDALLWTVVKDD